MTRAEMLDRMSSAELSGWQAIYRAEHEEAEEARLQASSPDGQVFIYGRDDDEEDEDDDGDDDSR